MLTQIAAAAAVVDNFSSGAGALIERFLFICDLKRDLIYDII
jgi:hypothetical protein